MACWSKLPPEVKNLSCRTILHPWTDSCLLGALRTFLDSCIGSSGFFFLLYAFQYISTVLKKKKKANQNDYLFRFLRSTAFGASVSTITIISHCILRSLLGTYYYPTTVFIPAVIGGLSVFIENRKGQDLATNVFANGALELFLKLLERSNILRWNSNSQTFIFMIASSLLSSLMNWANYDLNYFWFFIPPKEKKTPDDDVCFHGDSCSKYIFKLFIMYSTSGVVLQSLRLLIKHFKSPKMFLLLLMSPKLFKLAAFLGGYVVIYQAIRCFLYRKQKKYSLIHDSLAGFLAGAAFRFQPTTAIFNSAVITTIEILAEVAYHRKLLPNFPYKKLVFALLCGVLFHCRIFMSEDCPQIMTYITSSVTHGISDRVAAVFEEIFKNLSSKI